MEEVVEAVNKPLQSLEGPEALYFWAKAAHVLGLLLWAGGLLAFTRLAARAVGYENPDSRTDSLKTYRRMHVLVDWLGLALVLVSGLWLLFEDPAGKVYLKHESGYFHIKLGLVAVLVVCDVIFTRKLFRSEPGGAFGYFLLHLVAALAMAGALVAVYVVRG